MASSRQASALSSFRTRRYVQDERYFAIEHMDVRREASLGNCSCIALPPAWPRPASRPVPGLTFSLQSWGLECFIHETYGPGSEYPPQRPRWIKWDGSGSRTFFAWPVTKVTTRLFLRVRLDHDGLYGRLAAALFQAWRYASSQVFWSDYRV
jgi:hypothetical protein